MHGMRRSATAALLVSIAVTAHAQLPDWTSKLSIHGTLSQAYAISEDYQVLGIPTGGTADYRDLALQLRFDQDPKNRLVLQLRHERLGDSPRSQSSDAVELDWAFYQHNVSDRLSLKAGRIPLPLGIFNEARGAGTTFPFYRPPGEFYEGQYASKTLEGVLGSYSMPGPSGWSFDADAYFGEWTLDQWEGDRADAKNAWGGQLWVNSPIPGLRVGSGAYRCRVEAPDGDKSDYFMLHGSVEADVNRWLMAAEYLSGNLDEYGHYRAWYGQAGYQITEKLSAHARVAVAKLDFSSGGYDRTSNVSDDFGLAVNYAIHPLLLLKLEGHTNEGLLREDMPRNLYASPSKTRYVIFSVVAGF